ncbi:DUF6255 family natural product biosynthesis protein [Streptomyces gamaensis]|uniref:DUF6255 family natural product biosynthesis protein n=1 Tax=Streptomyces gamaensis TaxID=1763542 RepID=A0ABW0Z042_9ACTN
MTARCTGRLVNHCLHDSGWRLAQGVERCASGCGTERFTGYEALLLPHPPPREGVPEPGSTLPVAPVSTVKPPGRGALLAR